MATEANAQPVGSTLDQTVPAHRASWVDRLIVWIKHLPIPAWLFYPGAAALWVLALNASRWVDGTVPIGIFDSPYSGFAVYPVGFLAAIHYLDETASRAFDAFRPALGRSEDELARLKHELTSIPAHGAWIAAAIGAIFTYLIDKSGDALVPGVGGGFSFAILYLDVTVGFVFFAEIVYHTIRQLRLVSHLHTLATNIDLLHLAPVYAFSQLTARTGLVFLLAVTFDLIANPFTLTTQGLVWLNILMLPLMAACFVLPLMGMHWRIVAEKHQLLFEVNQRVEASIKQLYQHVDAANLTDAHLMNKSISSVIAARELIMKIPTWPWEHETFVMFFSVLALPLVGFLIEMSLRNWLGFK